MNYRWCIFCAGIGARQLAIAIVLGISFGSNASGANTITSPLSGATVSGIVPVSVPAAIARVLSVYVDGKYIGSSLSNSYRWNTTIYSNGPHLLSVKAYESTGAVIENSFINVVVDNGGMQLNAGAGGKPRPAGGRFRDISGSSKLTVRVAGNRLVNGSGQTIRLIGVNRSGTEFQCVSNAGIFDGPSDDNSVAAIAAWHVNAVRIPLNEDCWLGINGVSEAYSGANYRKAIVKFVNLLHRHRMYAVVDLHWNAPGSNLATSQQEMADADHAPAFWTSVAKTFKHDPATLFDLYNEPNGAASDWSCWLNGCITSSGWQAAGMQTLLNAVRKTGARNVIIATGGSWGNDLSGWLANEPKDPAHALVAGVHIYDSSACNTGNCFASMLAPVKQQVPLVAGEFGEHDCNTQMVNPLMKWFDRQGAGYLGWSWDTGPGWSCSSGPALITDYSGNPNSYGAALQEHLAALSGN
jgi:hypothetical protein